MFIGKIIRPDAPYELVPNCQRADVVNLTHAALDTNSQQAQLYLKVDNQDNILITHFDRKTSQISTIINLFFSSKSRTIVTAKKGIIHIAGFFQISQQNQTHETIENLRKNAYVLGDDDDSLEQFNFTDNDKQYFNTSSNSTSNTPQFPSKQSQDNHEKIQQNGSKEQKKVKWKQPEIISVPDKQYIKQDIDDTNNQASNSDDYIFENSDQDSLSFGEEKIDFFKDNNFISTYKNSNFNKIFKPKPLPAEEQDSLHQRPKKRVKTNEIVKSQVIQMMKDLDERKASIQLAKRTVKKAQSGQSIEEKRQKRIILLKKNHNEDPQQTKIRKPSQFDINLNFETSSEEQKPKSAAQTQKCDNQC